MKQVLLIAAILLSIDVNAQTFTQNVKIPVQGDTITEMTTTVLNSPAAGETLKTLDLHITQRTQGGWTRSFNKTVPNDTALANKLRLAIIKEATKK